MNNNNTFLTIAILVIVGAIAIIFFISPPDNIQVNSTCEQYKETFSQAIRTNDPASCNSISDKTCSQNCIYTTAQLNQTETHCSLIEDGYIKSKCYADLAPSKGVQLCDLITENSEIRAEGFSYYCTQLNSNSDIILSEGKALCVNTPLWKDQCIISTGQCSLLSDPKLEDMCTLESHKGEFYAGTSQLDCASLNLPESQSFCESAKIQKVGMASSFVSENLEATCGNKLCNSLETHSTCPQDCKPDSNVE